MKIILICDFSRSVLNTRSYPHLLQATNKDYFILSGCIAIAFVAMLASKGINSESKARTFLKRLEFVGDLLTFSTFALESATLMKSGHPKVAFLYNVIEHPRGVVLFLLLSSSVSAPPNPSSKTHIRNNPADTDGIPQTMQ